MDTTAVDSLLNWLLRTSLEASVLVVAVLAMRLIVGIRLSPGWRIGLWMLVGLKLVLPACIPAGFGLGQWLNGPGLQAAQSQPIGPRSNEVQFRRLHSEPLPASAVSPPAPSGDENRGVSLQALPVDRLILGLWLAGSLTLLGVAILRQRRLERHLRSCAVANDPQLLSILTSLQRLAGVKRNVTVVLIPAHATPAIVGIRKPRLLLPEDWQMRFDNRSLRHVLLHELLHVRHCDLIWNWMALALQSLHWFNPLVWIAVARCQADRELRCDARVLELLAPSERLAYGHTLLRIQETFFAPPAVAGLAPCVRNHPSLRQRITMITHPTKRQPWLQTLLALTISVLTCYSFTTARAERDEAVPAKERSREGERSTKSDGSDASDAKQSGMPNGIAAVVNGQVITKNELRKAMEADGGKRSEEEVLGALVQERLSAVKDKGRSGTGDGEGGARKTGMRDGEAKKTGSRDGEANTGATRDGDLKKTGARDGEARKTGPSDGEGKKDGARDREGVRKPAERDGDRQKPGARDGEGKKAGQRDGTGDSASATSKGETIIFRVVKNGGAVMIGDEEVPMNRLRGPGSCLASRHT